MPQAIIEMMPAFGNLAVQNLKDTALVSLISIADLTFQAQSLRNITLDSATIYTLTLIGYFIIALGLMVIIRFIEMKLRRGAAFPQERPFMMYGYAWDTTTPLTFALSILPILGIGLLVTLKAAAVGLRDRARPRARPGASASQPRTRQSPGQSPVSPSSCATRRCWCSSSFSTMCCPISGSSCRPS